MSAGNQGFASLVAMGTLLSGLKPLTGQWGPISTWGGMLKSQM